MSRIKFIVTLALLAVIALAQSSFAADSQSNGKPPSAQKAYDELLRTRFFAFGGVGFAGTMSESEKAFHTLAADAERLTWFKSAVASTNATAKLYGLCGLRTVAPALFETEAESLMKANPEVQTMQGCIVTNERAAEVIRRIKKGAFDKYLKGSKER